MMLAIHDIGETIVGDIITVNRDRSIDEKKEEDDAVKTLLNPEQRDLYQEYEANQNLTAKFAKAMDKLSAQIMVCSTDPAIEKARYEHFGFSLDDWSKYEKYMKRDSFLHEFFHHVWSSVREDWEQVK